MLFGTSDTSSLLCSSFFLPSSLLGPEKFLLEEWIETGGDENKAISNVQPMIQNGGQVVQALEEEEEEEATGVNSNDARTSEQQKQGSPHVVAPRKKKKKVNFGTSVTHNADKISQDDSEIWYTQQELSLFRLEYWELVRHVIALMQQEDFQQKRRSAVLRKLRSLQEQRDDDGRQEDSSTRLLEEEQHDNHQQNQTLSDMLWTLVKGNPHRDGTGHQPGDAHLDNESVLRQEALKQLVDFYAREHGPNADESSSSSEDETSAEDEGESIIGLESNLMPELSRERRGRRGQFLQAFLIEKETFRLIQKQQQEVDCSSCIPIDHNRSITFVVNEEGEEGQEKEEEASALEKELAKTRENTMQELQRLSLETSQPAAIFSHHLACAQYDALRRQEARDEQQRQLSQQRHDAREDTTSVGNINEMDREEDEEKRDNGQGSQEEEDNGVSAHVQGEASTVAIDPPPPRKKLTRTNSMKRMIGRLQQRFGSGSVARV